MLAVYLYFVLRWTAPCPFFSCKEGREGYRKPEIRTSTAITTMRQSFALAVAVAHLIILLMSAFSTLDMGPIFAAEFRPKQASYAF